jgi:hypothetical protein
MFAMLSARLGTNLRARGKLPAANLVVNAAGLTIASQSTENKSGYCKPTETGGLAREAARCALTIRIAALSLWIGLIGLLTWAGGLQVLALK